MKVQIYKKKLFYDYQFKFFNSVYSNCAELVRGQNQSTHNEHECVIRFPQNWFFSVCPFFSPKISLSAWVRPTIQKSNATGKPIIWKNGSFLSVYVLHYTKIPKNTNINWTHNFQIKAGRYLRNHQTIWECNGILSWSRNFIFLIAFSQSKFHFFQNNVNECILNVAAYRKFFLLTRADYYGSFEKALFIIGG